MNTIHIHLHLPDADSTEKVVPLLKDFLQSADKVTEASIDRALPQTAAAIEKKLDAMDFKEEPAPKKKSSRKKITEEPAEEPTPEVTPEKSEAPTEDIPSREDVYAMMNNFIQSGSDNRKKVFNLIKKFDVSAFREIPDEELSNFVDGLKELGA